MAMKNCRICDKYSSLKILDFGKQPIVHNLLKTKNSNYEKYEFSLGACEECNFLSLMSPISPEILYQNYFTVSSWKFQPHTSRLIELMKQILGMNKDTKILDIGCNDGSFLKELMDHGIKKVRGIEPTLDAYNLCLKDNLDVEKGFFPTVNTQKNEYDIIVFRQVLEHIIDLDTFLSGVKIALKNAGGIVIEIPDTSFNLEHLDFTLWEEHVNYFTLNTLRKLLAKHGIEIIHHERTLFSGVALTVFAQKSSEKISVQFSEDDDKKIKLFKSKFTKFKKELLKFLSLKKNVAIYGCGARSSNFVNLLGLDMIKCFIDDQKEKQNLFVPGYNIPTKAWDEKFQNFTILLGVGTENEEKVISKRNLNRDKCFSILPPSKILPQFWRNLINK